MKTIKDYNFENQRAIMRVDFNVPLDANFNITDDTRITAAIPSIKKILSDKGSVILMSHLGRPKGGPEDKYSLKHLLPHLSKLLNLQVKFADDCIGASAIEMSSKLKPGEVLLLENLRFYKEEEKGDEIFAEKLAKLADVYVNDAFGTAHRAHASTAIIAKFFPTQKMFGYLMAKELESIDKVLKSPARPYTAILGGAKISGKIEIIKNLIDKVDNIIIGGGMMFTFLKSQGHNVGSSLIEDDFVELAKTLLAEAKLKGVNILLPSDAIIADKFDNEANKKACQVTSIPEGWMGLDIGENSIAAFKDTINKSKTILWNGPMGVFEMSNFEHGTKAVAQLIAETTATNSTFSLIGGGDSVAAINKYNLAEKVSYVSTGGGALLEYMEGKILPGVHAINE